MAETALDPFVVVLNEPQDLVNVALVVRAMKNMGLGRLRVVRPAEELDPVRLEGIAHGTADVIRALEQPGSLEEALADLQYVVGTSARRRASRQRWLDPAEDSGELIERSREGPVGLLFGREDRGLSNEELDRCHAVACVATSPEHPSLNLAHAALLVFYELRQAAAEAEDLPSRDLSPKRRRTSPPPSAAEMEDFFEAWEEAMERVGFFHHIEPEPKMRSFRSIFQRADLDGRELKLLEAAAYEVIHFTRRVRARVLAEPEGDGEAD